MIESEDESETEQDQDEENDSVVLKDVVLDVIIEEDEENSLTSLESQATGRSSYVPQDKKALIAESRQMVENKILFNTRTIEINQ